ncbi:MAG: bifunctional metallophosphatase/5'-nucleotidase, partial [Bacteroidales bacterium]|nr:bifunctional metallophosphatase/5'-nucleotidase [Bacteroidales bacterium]
MEFKNIIRFCGVAASVVCILAACEKDPLQPAENYKPKAGEYYLPMIETTDIHGHLVEIESNTVHYRLAYIADKVQDIRFRNGKTNKNRLLLLDGGDLYQGASVSNLLSGKPVYTAMDLMGYDAVALGNHEFDWGVEDMIDTDATLPDYEWNGSMHSNQIPVLCANLYRNGSRVSFTRDYEIVEKTAIGARGDSVKVKIGIVGFAQDYAGSIMATQFTGKGYSIQENYQIANDIAASLEASGQCHATVLLTHEAAANAATKLGAGSPFDLVLGGHSHRTASGLTDWGLPYLQGGRYCEHYAYADLRFIVDQDGNVTFKGVNNRKIVAVEPSRDIHNYPGQNSTELSEDIMEVSDYAISATLEQQNDVIGYITVGATSWYLNGSGDRAATISNWMCDIIRRIGGADVAFVNAGGIRTTLPLNGQSRRDITVANVYEMFPFNNTIYVYEITYAELLQLLEYSMTSGGQSLFSRMTGIDCRYTQTEHVSSSGDKWYTYAVYSLSMDENEIYRNHSWAGDWASRTLILAVSEYLATTERTDYYTNLSNPLLEWNSSPRLRINDMIDNENAVRVLRSEAAASSGHL